MGPGDWGSQGSSVQIKTWWEAGPNHFTANRGHQAKEARLHLGHYKEPCNCE